MKSYDQPTPFIPPPLPGQVNEAAKAASPSEQSVFVPPPLPKGPPAAAAGRNDVGAPPVPTPPVLERPRKDARSQKAPWIVAAAVILCVCVGIFAFGKRPVSVPKEIENPPAEGTIPSGSEELENPPAESAVSDQPSIKINEALLEDIGRTYGEMCALYGGVAQSDYWQGARWFWFEDTRPGGYFFMYKGDAFSETPDDSAECFHILTGADGAFVWPNDQSRVPYEQFIQDLDVSVESQGRMDDDYYGSSYEYYLTFIYKETYRFHIEYNEKDFISKRASVTIQGMDVLERNSAS